MRYKTTATIIHTLKTIQNLSINSSCVRSAAFLTSKLHGPGKASIESSSVILKLIRKYYTTNNEPCK
jgi:hypothetical protein